MSALADKVDETKKLDVCHPSGQLLRRRAVGSAVSAASSPCSFPERETCCFEDNHDDCYHFSKSLRRLQGKSCVVGVLTLPFVLFSITFIICSHRCSLPSTVIVTRAWGHKVRSSPPSPLRHVPCNISARRERHFLSVSTRVDVCVSAHAIAGTLGS